MPVYTTPDRELTVIFDRQIPEEAEALDYFRAAFGETAGLEAVNEFVFALHIRPYLVRKAGENA
jgi:hypothetical protein